jgi:hypothetical protein
LSQPVQPLQAVLDVSVPYQLPQILFCTDVSVEDGKSTQH